VCVPGYSKKVRGVPAWLKRQAYAEYGIMQYKTGDYEVDHTGNEVWVKTRSGKYWKPGSRFYGKTKQGESMPESDALDRGYSPGGGIGQ
jgi:hypothetical protein